jgi:hypothetical protein
MTERMKILLFGASLSDLFGWEVDELHRHFGVDVHFVGCHTQSASEYVQLCGVAKPDIVYVPASAMEELLRRKDVPLFAEMIELIPHYLQTPTDEETKVMAVVHSHGPLGIEYEAYAA